MIDLKGKMGDCVNRSFVVQYCQDNVTGNEIYVSSHKRKT